MKHNIFSRRWKIVGLAALLGGSMIVGTWAADTNRPPEDRPAPPRGQTPPPGNVQRAIDDLKLSEEQKTKAAPIVEQFQQAQRQARENLLKQMKEVLTAEQFSDFESKLARPPRRNAPPTPPADRPNSSAEEKTTAAIRTTPQADLPPARDGATRMPVTLTGGYATDPRDGGRPVVLIAAALNVPPETFRETFTHVRPAGPGGEPQEAQVRQNKHELMSRLGPLGVTDDRLNEVSNRYRYASWKNETWRHKPAVVFALVKDGKFAGFEIVDAGYGYSSVPTVTVDGMADVHGVASLAFSTDFAKNGSIKEIALNSK